MRITRITTAEQVEFGDHHVPVEWQDGSTTDEVVAGFVSPNECARWLERKRGRKVRCWRR